VATYGDWVLFMLIFGNVPVPPIIIECRTLSQLRSKLDSRFV